MSTGTQIALIFILLILVFASAIFSSSETAYTSLSRAQLEQQIKDGKKSALLVRKHIHKFGRTLATILICNTLVNIGSGSLVTYLFADILGASSTVSLISTLVMTPILVIFGELIPKMLAKKSPLKYLKFLAYIIEVLNFALWPLTFPISKITLSSKITNTETDLLNLIRVATKEGVLEMSEAILAINALELDSTKIAEVMTKKKEFVYVNQGSTVEVALKIFKESGHSRLPVKNGDKFVGILLLKDIFSVNSFHIIDKYAKSAFFLSKNILLSKALEKLRFNKTHMALVTDSSKSTTAIGLITLEDIIESLIGEIYDEHDKVQVVSEIAHFKWTILGNASMQDVVRETKMKVKVDELEMTLKEFMQDKINRRVKKGLKYIYNDHFTFIVISNKKNSETIIEITRK